VLFLAQGLWLTGHQALTDRDYQYARCGREMWERPAQLAGYFTSCGNIHDGILAYRLAGLPLTLNLLAERGLDHFRNPENRVVQTSGELSAWELRHQLRYTLLLLRLPFLAAGCLLGAGLWWVTRRLYGNLGGYTALGLYCFSPAVLRACVTPNAEILASLGVYAGVYTCIGVAHAMQGPRRKWRPRILLLMAAFGLAAASHIAALPVVALLGLIAMLWVAEGRRSQVLPMVLAAMAGALVFWSLPATASRRMPSATSSALPPDFLWVSLDPARRFFFALPNAGITVAAGCCTGVVSGFAQVALLRQHGSAALRPGFNPAHHDRRSGRSLAVGAAVSAYVCGGSLCRRLRGTARTAGAGRCRAIVLLQAVFCVLSLPGLL
jgi:hypothetical protein